MALSSLAYPMQNVLMQRRKISFGPGILVTAAFIGPGTITTASLAGAGYGYNLLWALLFSVAATMILQEMTARLGLVTRRGLAESLRASFSGSAAARLIPLLIVLAVGFGNAAYQGGNITGAALGLAQISQLDGPLWALMVAALAAALLMTGAYRVIERTLVVLVLLMSTVFLLTWIMSDIHWQDLARGLLTPRLPSGSLLTVIALIGTTVVPYNLFLHANAVQETWGDSPDICDALQQARWDSGLSIALGGLITMAIVGTAAAAFHGSGEAFSAVNMAAQLEPLLGDNARIFFAAGLFAAGLSSAVTAPLAAVYAVNGAMGWPQNLSSNRSRTVALAVLTAGTLFATGGLEPLTAILFAQAANGFLLPICAVFLLLAMNQETTLGTFRNGLGANLAGGVVVAVSAGLGSIKIAQALGFGF